MVGSHIEEFQESKAEKGESISSLGRISPCASILGEKNRHTLLELGSSSSSSSAQTKQHNYPASSSSSSSTNKPNRSVPRQKLGKISKFNQAHQATKKLDYLLRVWHPASNQHTHTHDDTTFDLSGSLRQEVGHRCNPMVASH